MIGKVFEGGKDHKYLYYHFMRSVVCLLCFLTMAEYSSSSSSAYSIGAEMFALFPSNELLRLLLLEFELGGSLRAPDRWIALVPFLTITLLVDLLSSKSMISMPSESPL